MHVCCCRFCGASLGATMVDLGMSPLANAYLTAEQLLQMEPFYPLRVYVCERCWLVQLEAFTATHLELVMCGFAHVEGPQ
jgi:Putative zinc binding domain